MEFLKIVLFALVLISMGSVRAADNKSDCVIQAQDPMIQQFFRSKGYDVDDEKGDFKAEFEVTCEAIDQQKDTFSSSERHQTTTKLEIFNEYENNKVIYHSESALKTSGRMEGTSFVVPCVDTREMKLKLLEASLPSLKEINCSEN